jgi:hypothetical protein
MGSAPTKTHISNRNGFFLKKYSDFGGGKKK